MPLPSAPLPRSAATDNPPPASNERAVAATRALAVASLAGLILLGLAWELWLAPVRPGGSLLALKVLPLVLPLAGLLKRRMYTYRWVSLLVWIHFTEGVVRAWSDTQLAGRVLAGELGVAPGAHHALGEIDPHQQAHPTVGVHAALEQARQGQHLSLIHI